MTFRRNHSSYITNHFFRASYSPTVKTEAAGHAIAQEVSRWFPTAAARDRARVWQMGFVVDKVALGQVFSEYFGFPPHSTKFSIITITRGRSNRPFSGRRAEWTQFGPHPLLCEK
jgi:hypothetical protein